MMCGVHIRRPMKPYLTELVNSTVVDVSIKRGLGYEAVAGHH